MALACQPFGPILTVIPVDYDRTPQLVLPAMPTIHANRKWHRLHASTWVVALVAVAALVLLVVPGAYTDQWIHTSPIYQHGWPWPFLEYYGIHNDRDEESIPWLLRQAWDFEGDVRWRLLAADVACALGITALVITAWEWRRRRRQRVWQVTLSELFLAMLAICCGLGWWQINAREAARQRSVANALSGDVYKTFEFRGPVWLYRLTGQRSAWLRCTSVLVWRGTLPRRPSSDHSLRLIGKLPDIEDLVLEADGDLAPLRELFSLRELWVMRCTIDEENGKVLAGLPALGMVRLQSCRISPAGLSQLRENRRIEVLHLLASALTQEGLAQVSQMDRIMELSLIDAGMTDDSMAELSRMTGLKELSLRDNRITDAGLRHLRNLKNLEDLRLFGTDVTAVGVQELSRHLPRCGVFWAEAAQD